MSFLRFWIVRVGLRLGLLAGVPSFDPFDRLRAGSLRMAFLETRAGSGWSNDANYCEVAFPLNLAFFHWLPREKELRGRTGLLAG